MKEREWIREKKREIGLEKKERERDVRIKENG